MGKYEIVIGFEVHTELKTESKLWCGCPTVFGNEPNTQTCPVCLGLPGSLPVLNEKAFDISLMTALALNCDVPDACHFDRKNYYYPDLPKNYQISQQYRPLGRDGYLDVKLSTGEVKRIGIDNIHLEEDAGKNIHPASGGHTDYSLIDLNRAATPLLEIVTKPEIHTRDEAENFMKTMKLLLEYLDASDCKMEEGRLRFELNISLRKEGSKEFGQKVEIKNLNSMTTVMKCIDAEYDRQSEMLDEGKRILGETRLWDDVREETRAMRSKESSYDYRYFPDPDLVDYSLPADRVAELKANLPELSTIRRDRFVNEFEIPDYDAGVLTATKSMADFFEGALKTGANPKTVSNWIMTEVSRTINDMGEDARVTDLKFSPDQMGKLVKMIDDGSITGKIAKTVYPLMAETGKDPAVIVEEKGLKPLDESALEPLVEEVIAANPAMADQIRDGKLKAIGGLMGQVMKKSGGKADPQKVQEIIKSLLGVTE